MIILSSQPNGMILTKAGRNLLAKALTGKTLAFTRCMCGNGEPGDSNLYELTELISPKRELPIQSIQTTGAIGTCEVVVEMDNKNLAQGFFVSEFGLFAKDPDTDQEILYSYCYHENASYLEGSNGIDLINYVVSLITVVDQAENITAVIENSNNYVTVSKLNAKFQDLFANHKDISGFWTFAENDTQRLRPSSLAQTRLSLIGTHDIESLVSRVERLEDALSQTLLELEMQNVFPGYSHFIIEDFKIINQLDMYTCAVTSVVAGDDSVDCEPLDGMLPGSWYTLTDGIFSELVQVDSISLENGIQRVILKEPVKNTYTLANTQMFRTSAQIDSNIALGPDARKSFSWSPSLIWQGRGANSDFTVRLNSSMGNSDAFNFSGNISLNSDSYITLAD